MDYQRIAAFLIGNATQDAEIKQAKQGSSQYGDFRLAVRNRQGETNYFPVRCFGKLAEGLTAIRKGARVFVEGELEMSSFVGDAGEKRMTFRILANTYRILGNGRFAATGENAEVA
jgi:single-stranded DNA-binding protein